MNVGIRQAVAYFRDASVSGWHKLVGLLAVVYVLSPIDLIPDAIPVLGWLDDVGVVALVAGWYLRQISLHAARAKNPAALPSSGTVEVASRS